MTFKDGFQCNKRISFTIRGDPVGAVRTTHGMKNFNPNYQRYLDYKDLVIAAFADQCDCKWAYRKPLTTKKGHKVVMDLKIYHSNGVHPDADNVFKAIADALFKNDRYVAGSFDFDYDSSNPRVEVLISGDIYVNH